MQRGRRDLMKAIGQQAGAQSRNSKYQDDYPDRIRQMAHDGMFIEQWAAELAVVPATLYLWANTYRDFEVAMEEAFTILAARWTAMGVSNMTNPKFQAGMWLKIVARRFPSLYGENPLATEEHYRNRNAVVAPGAAAGEGDLGTASAQELLNRLQELERRRQHDQEDGA